MFSAPPAVKKVYFCDQCSWNYRTVEVFQGRAADVASCWCGADQWSDDEDWALLGFLQSTSLSSADINQAHRAALPHRNILSPLSTYCMFVFVCVYEGEPEGRVNEATHLHLFYGNNLFRKKKPNPIASRRTFIKVSSYIQWIWRNCTKTALLLLSR